MNWASISLGCRITSSSSELPHCESGNVLGDDLSKIWLSDYGLPQWLSISLTNTVEESVEIRSIGWCCWHAYSTNPRDVRLHVSQDGVKFRVWDTFRAECKAGTQLFCCAPISTVLYPYIAFEILTTFGGNQTYLNRIYLYSEEVVPSFISSSPTSSSGSHSLRNSDEASVLEASRSLNRAKQKSMSQPFYDNMLRADIPLPIPSDSIEIIARQSSAVSETSKSFAEPFALMPPPLPHKEDPSPIHSFAISPTRIEARDNDRINNSIEFEKRLKQLDDRLAAVADVMSNINLQSAVAMTKRESQDPYVAESSARSSSKKVQTDVETMDDFLYSRHHSLKDIDSGRLPKSKVRKEHTKPISSSEIGKYSTSKDCIINPINRLGDSLSSLEASIGADRHYLNVAMAIPLDNNGVGSDNVTTSDDIGQLIEELHLRMLQRTIKETQLALFQQKAKLKNEAKK
eukprot:scaffold1244_cov162-Ochromonas_danica.AAC.51